MHPRGGRRDRRWSCDCDFGQVSKAYFEAFGFRNGSKLFFFLISYVEPLYVSCMVPDFDTTSSKPFMVDQFDLVPVLDS